MRHPLYRLTPEARRGFYVLMGGLLVLMLCGWGIFGFAARPSQPVTAARSSTPQPTQQPTTTPVPPPVIAPAVLTVGQTLQTEADYECTLTKVKILQPGEFDSLKSGDEYIVVTVKLVNNTDQPQSYNALDFGVKSGTGNIAEYTYSSNYTANNELDYGSLAPYGGTVTGDLVFEVGKHDHQAMLLWSPDFNQNTTNGWLLGL